MNLCLKACPMRSRSSLENLPSGYVRLTKSPQMRSMSSSLMLWSSAMGSGQSGSGCRNASAMPSTSVRPSRWEIHRRATRGSVRCGGRAASHSDVGMPSARHCGVVMLLVGVENSWPRDPKRLVCGWSWVMPRRRLRGFQNVRNSKLGKVDAEPRVHTTEMDPQTMRRDSPCRDSPFSNAHDSAP
jgi:hypothetical protein